MRTYSLAYLTANASTVPQAIDIAAALGYASVGVRLWPNAPGAPHQALLHDPAIERETLARLRDGPVRVFDIEIVRIGEHFDPQAYRPLFDAGARLGARAVLVAGDDADRQRLAHNYARLCETLQAYGMTADLEFMPWTAVKNARDALDVVRLAAYPAQAGVLIDALHFQRSDTTLDDLRALPPALLHYAQACDAPPGEGLSVEQLIHAARCERALPGEGAIDLAALFQALPANVPVSVEIPHQQRSCVIGDLAWARQALAATRKALGDL